MASEEVILVVRSEPTDPGLLDSYHAWYAEHVKQLLAVPGVEDARRFESIDGDIRFMAMYRMESKDIFESEAYRSVGRFGAMEPHVRYTRNVYQEISLSGRSPASQG